MDGKIRKKLIDLLEKTQEIKNISLFVVLKRDDSDLWDLVIGGKQLDNQKNLQEIAKLFIKTFDKNEITYFSRLVLLNSSDEFVKSFHQAFSIKADSAEIVNSRINNVFIKEAHLFYSK